MNADILWPDHGDRLFVDDAPTDSDAQVMATSVLTWISMAEGYAKAAELAVSNVEPFERNSIVYPVVFCYRHAVELYLKYARRIARSLFSISPNSKKVDHDLWKIWLELRPLIERSWPNDPDQDLNATEAMIKEFHTVDQNAQKYRFPISRKGDRHFPSNESIDLVTFCRSGRKIINFLAACSDGMSEAIHAC